MHGGVLSNYINNICVIYVFNIFSQQNLASYYAIWKVWNIVISKSLP